MLANLQIIPWGTSTLKTYGSVSKHPIAPGRSHRPATPLYTDAKPPTTLLKLFTGWGYKLLYQEDLCCLYRPCSFALAISAAEAVVFSWRRKEQLNTFLIKRKCMLPWLWLHQATPEFISSAGEILFL